MNITVIGTGYVGLVTGVCLSEIGHHVTCIDIDEQKVAKMQQGISPIYEPGLEELMKINIYEGRLTFTTSHNEGIANAEAIYIAVGTPQAEDGSANLDYVLQAALDIAHHANRNGFVITKSTVPVGTNRRIQETVNENLVNHVQLQIVSNPEFLREGHAIFDTFHGDRIVIGTDNEQTAKAIAQIYESLKIPFVFTNLESAEMIKYAANTFLATKISFINEIANICEEVGADIQDVAQGMGLDHRIGTAFLNAGIGYGGSCFPKDTYALMNIANNVGYDFKILNEVIKVNQAQRQYFTQKVFNRFGSLEDKQISILGLAFKPNTDDMREAPSITIINELLSLGANIKAYDPVSIQAAKKVLPACVYYSETIEEALVGADACLIITEWEEIKELNLERVKNVMKTPIIFDGRNCLLVDEVEKVGIEYHPIGRANRKLKYLGESHYVSR